MDRSSSSILYWIYEAIGNNFLYITIGVSVLILLAGLIRFYFRLKR